MLDRTATTWLKRLLVWLELFEQDFSRQSQRGALRRYVTGLLSDSRRKSMEAMWARLSDPGTYQAFQHFITHAPWDAEVLWKRLRARVPERTGVLILDGTSFPKQGTASVGVARQYCGARGKIANCQTAVTVALWTGTRAWLLGATLYLPEEWLTPGSRARAQIPATVRFAPKWQLALTLLRQVRAAGFTLTAVVGDAEFGDNATLRRTLHRAQLPYALGVSSDLKVFLGTPRARIAAAADRQRASAHAPAVAVRHPDRRSARVGGHADASPVAVGVVAQWDERPVARPLLCGPGHARPRLAGATARARSLAAVRTRTGGGARVRYYLVDLPSTASLRAVVRLAHQRWAIEQQYQELKDEIGLDHFEGRSLPGWQRHVVLTAIAYSFLQIERRRRGQTHLTLPRVRAVIQEVLTAHFFMTQPHYLKWMLKLKDVEMRT